MARRSRQLELALPNTWGGRRAGAGRKPAAGRRRSTPHRARPEHKKAHPVHLTMRARAGAAVVAPGGRCSRRWRWRSLRRGKETFRVVHFSVQSDHVHLMVEASDKRSLSERRAGLGGAHRSGGEPRARPRGARVGRPLPHACPAQPARGSQRSGLRAHELSQAPGRQRAFHRSVQLGAVVRWLSRARWWRAWAGKRGRISRSAAAHLARCSRVAQARAHQPGGKTTRAGLNRRVVAPAHFLLRLFHSLRAPRMDLAQ